MIDTLTVHHRRDLEADTGVPDPHQDVFSKTVLGFWMYLMTDCLLFTALFATYAVLHANTFGGPGSADLFSLPTAFAETMILLCSSVTCGFAMLSAVRSDKAHTLLWLAVTMLLGGAFLALELHEFYGLALEGNSWTRSGFLSAFFTLVGTHGLHITVGLSWLLVLLAELSLTGLTAVSFRRLVLFSMFWHFLDLVWIFIFTFVYLIGVL